MDLNEELKKPRSYLSISTIDGSTFNTELFEPYSYRTRTYASYTPSSHARYNLVSSRRAAEDEIDASKKRGYIEANGTYIPWTNIKSIQVRSE